MSRRLPKGRERDEGAETYTSTSHNLWTSKSGSTLVVYTSKRCAHVFWAVVTESVNCGEDMYTLGGNVHRILLQNEPIFTKCQENTHSEGRQNWIFSSLIIFSVLGRWYFRATLPILSTLYRWIGIKHCKWWWKSQNEGRAHSKMYTPLQKIEHYWNN